MRGGKRCLTDDVGKSAGTVCEQTFAVRQQEVEFAIRADVVRELAQAGEQYIGCGRAVGETLGQRLQDVAEGAFRIGRADRHKTPVQRRGVFLQVAVMGEDPVLPPQLTLKRVGVVETDLALRGLANVRNGVERTNGVVAHQFGDRRIRAWARVEERAHSAPLKKGDAPAVAMMVGQTAARAKAGKRETDVRRDIAVHAEQLAHDVNPGYCRPGMFFISASRSMLPIPGTFTPPCIFASPGFWPGRHCAATQRLCMLTVVSCMPWSGGV